MMGGFVRNPHHHSQTVERRKFALWLYARTKELAKQHERIHPNIDLREKGGVLGAVAEMDTFHRPSCKQALCFLV